MEERIVELAQRLAERLPPGDLDQTLTRITAAPTDQVLCDVDATQYEMQEGPCYEAAADTGNVVAPDLFRQQSAIALAYAHEVQDRDVKLRLVAQEIVGAFAEPE